MTTNEVIEILKVEAADYKCVGNTRDASLMLQAARKVQKLANERDHWKRQAESLAIAVMTDATAQG